jgi:hypothetical protein
VLKRTLTKYDYSNGDKSEINNKIKEFEQELQNRNMPKAKIGVTMRRMDLRQVGTITGLPMYIDFAGIKDFKAANEILSERDKKEILVTKMLQSAFGVPKDQEGNDEKN